MTEKSNVFADKSKNEIRPQSRKLDYTGSKTHSKTAVMTNILEQILGLPLGQAQVFESLQRGPPFETEY